MCNQKNLFWWQLPKKLVIGLVGNTTYSDAYDKNPFNFKHFSVNFVALYVNGKQVSSDPLQPNYDQSNYVHEYMQLAHVSGGNMKDHPPLIPRGKLNNGNALYPSALYTSGLCPDQACMDHYFLIKTGNLRAEICFAQPLPTTINIIV